jgi:uncharacterized membrane protein
LANLLGILVLDESMRLPQYTGAALALLAFLVMAFG